MARSRELFGNLPQPLRRILNVLAGIILLPVALVLLLIVAPVGSWLDRPARRSREEVLNYLRLASDDKVDIEDWKRFTNKPIADRELDRVRVAACGCGPPNPDRLMLRQLIRELETAR